ncbi:sodium/potassium/calcium exchanger 1-like [Pecten maximus]|uniref:sodium/potassium/calcium exchanger 1-like n=1 Tax=Pecten maximus TaxID=6579 RepID=UPI001459046C|nr:sodium/potassium/calcium exchanger 1-like [Pecten maximus]
MTTVQGTEEETHNMTTVQGTEEETHNMTTVQGTEEEIQGMTRVEGKEEETHNMTTVQGTEEEIQGMTTVEGTEEEKHNMATLEGMEEEIQGLTTLEGTEVETQEMATVEGVEAEEISDSQLCAISTMDWTEEPLGPFGDTGRGHDSKTPAVPPSLPDGTAIVKSLIREVSNLNMMLLRAKREMQAANQRKLQTPTNDNRVNMLAKK